MGTENDMFERLLSSSKDFMKKIEEKKDEHVCSEDCMQGAIIQIGLHNDFDLIKMVQIQDKEVSRIYCPADILDSLISQLIKFRKEIHERNEKLSKKEGIH